MEIENIFALVLREWWYPARKPEVQENLASSTAPEDIVLNASQGANVRLSAQYARGLLKWLKALPELNAWSNTLKSFTTGINDGLFPPPHHFLAAPFDSANKLLAHGDLWLGFESSKVTPSAEDLSAMIASCQILHIVACDSSKLAYELAEVLLLRLRDFAQNTDNITVQAKCEMMRARAYAGLDFLAPTEAAASACFRLIRQGAEIHNQVVDGVCKTFTIGKRYQSILDFCTSQLRRLDENDARDIEHMNEALFWMARAYYAVGEYDLAQDCFERVLKLNPEANQKRLRLLVKYAEFLTSVGNRQAGAIIAQSIKLGRTLGVFPIKDVAEWIAQLNAQRGKKNFV